MRHRAGPEPLNIACHRPPDGFCAGGYPLSLPPTPAIPPPEGVVPGPAMHIFLCTLQLHTGFGPPDLSDSGDQVSAELFIGSIFPAGALNSAPKEITLELPSGIPRIPTNTSYARKLQSGGHQIPGA